MLQTARKALNAVPPALSSMAHIAFLIALGCWLVLLPLLGLLHPSSSAELIGGNYLNVTSDLGACIAAGAAAHVVREHRARRVIEAERERLLREVHSVMGIILHNTTQH